MSNADAPRGLAAAGRGERILYLDDEAPLVFLVVRMLERIGFAPAGFTEPAEALAAFRNAPQSFALVVSDLSMPGASGLEFARDVLSIAPETHVVIVSGCVDEADIANATSIGVRAVVQKPSTMEQLAQTISDFAQGAEPHP